MAKITIDMDLMDRFTGKKGMFEEYRLHEAPTDVADTLQDIADTVSGKVRPSYSGRGMGGDTCPAVVCDHHQVQQVQHLAQKKGLPVGRADNMGLKAIVYWPSLDALPESKLVP